MHIPRRDARTQIDGLLRLGGSRRSIRLDPARRGPDAPVSMTDASAPAPDGGPATSARVTLWISALGVFAVFLDTTVLFVAFPRIVASFPGTRATELSWVLNAYTIVYAALLVPAGKLSDRWGHKRTFLMGSVAFTLTSALCALAPNAWSLVLFRALQAVGGALIIPASLAIVIRSTPPRDLPVSVAVWGALGAVSGAVGPTLGAGIIAVMGWRGVFLLNVPVGILTVLLGRRRLRESANPETPIPALSGVLLVAAGAAVASLGFVQSESWGWTDPRTVACLTLGAVLLVIFAFAQRKTSAPVVDPSLFRHPTFVWANIATVALGLAFTAMFLGSILFLTQVWGWSTLAAGLGVSPGPTLVAFVAPRLGALARTTGQRPLIVLGGLIFAASGLHRLIFLDLEPNYLVDYLPSMLLSSLGIALTIPQLSSSIAQSIPSSHLGVGTATNQAIRQFAGTFGVALAIAFVGDAQSPAEAVLGFDRVWLLMVGSGLATSLLSVPIRSAQPA